jgi:hypothetical protein
LLTMIESLAISICVIPNKDSSNAP